MTKPYLERVKEVVSIDTQHQDIQHEIMEMFEVTKPIIFDGHFELLSLRHTDMFFRFAAISQYPYYVSLISKAMVKWLKSGVINSTIDVVLSPSSQGMFFAYDIARELNGTMRTRAVYTAIDKHNGYPSNELVEGFEIRAGEKVLVVNDMTTTGSGIETLVNVAQKAKAEVIGICIFGNRGVEEKKVKDIGARIPMHSIIELKMPSWSAQDCRKSCTGNRKVIRASQLNHLPIYATEDAYEKYLKRLEVA